MGNNAKENCTVLNTVLSFEKYFSIEELVKKLHSLDITLNKRQLLKKLNIYRQHGIIAKQNTFYKLLQKSDL